MMHNLQTLIENYLEYCGAQKRLDEKTPSLGFSTIFF